jgi:hypothetical protein
MAKKQSDDESLPTGSELPDSEPLTANIDPFVVIANLTEAINRLGQRQEQLEQRAAQSDGGDTTQELMATLGAALARVADANIKGSEQIAAEMRRSQRPSNEIVPMRSVYNQRGVLLDDYQKPPLKCVMFIPWFAEWESLTREEVELLNLLQPGLFRVSFNDEDEFEMSVKMEYALDGKTPSRLLMNNDKAHTQENHRRNIPLRAMLRQIVAQIPGTEQALAMVLTEKEEAAMIAAGKYTVSH